MVLRFLVADAADAAGFNAAGRGGQRFKRSLIFLMQKGFFDSLINKIPGKLLIDMAVPKDIEVRVDGCGFKGLGPVAFASVR